MDELEAARIISLTFVEPPGSPVRHHPSLALAIQRRFRTDADRLRSRRLVLWVPSLIPEQLMVRQVALAVIRTVGAVFVSGRSRVGMPPTPPRIVLRRT